MEKKHYYQGSAQGGKNKIFNKLPESLKKEFSQGYHMNKNDPDYKLALKYVTQKLGVNDSIFNHSYDCIYGNNYFHLEERGGHRYIRPSNTVKFVLKRGMDKFDNSYYSYGYHGTQSKFVKSIIDHGLQVPGTKLDNYNTVIMKHGDVAGTGIYSSKSPLVAESYATPEYFEGKWVSPIFMVRIDPNYIECGGCETYYTYEYFGRQDIYKLHHGLLKFDEIQTLTKHSSQVSLQALMIKISPEKPSPSCKESRVLCSLLDNYCDQFSDVN